jgi:hypothetical protein
VINLKDYLVATCDKLLVCTCSFIFIYMKSTLLSKLCVLADLIFSLHSRGELVVSKAVWYAYLL